MKRRKAKDLEGQFIDDLDPYEGDHQIPAPESSESDSAQAWQDFQDSVIAFQSEDDPLQQG